MAILGVPTRTQVLFPGRVFHLLFKKGQEPDFFASSIRKIFEAEKGCRRHPTSPVTGDKYGFGVRTRDKCDKLPLHSESG